MAIFISRSPEETEAFAKSLGATCSEGSVIGLTGELGAGKTQFVKGLARGLKFTGLVHSPTFALLNSYAGGRLPLFHLDLYRLETQEAIERAGLADYFSPAGVAVVEWIERWHGTLPRDYRHFRLEITSETERVVHY